MGGPPKDMAHAFTAYEVKDIQEKEQGARHLA